MEETLSWQAQLAKSNINITGVQYNPNHKTCVVCFEFPYHPKPGQVKWIKTAEEFIGVNANINELKKLMEDNKDLPPVYLHNLVPAIKNIVLSLRKELEG